jgi:Na+/H+-translocating membrane pyrophosphatase
MIPEIVTGVLVVTVPLAALVFGLFMLRNLFSRLRKMVCDLDEDEQSRIINRDVYETTTLVHGVLSRITRFTQWYLNSARLLFFALSVFLAVAVAIVLCTGVEQQSGGIDSVAAYGLISLAAFALGVVGSAAFYFVALSTSAPSSAICAVSCMEGSSEADAAKGFNAAFSHLFSTATALTLVILSVSLVGTAVSFFISKAKFGSDLYPAAGVISAHILGSLVVSTATSLHGGIIGGGMQLAMDALDKPTAVATVIGCMSCVGHILRDMFQFNSTLISVYGECTLMYFLVLRVAPASVETSSISLALLPLWLYSASLVASVVWCLSSSHVDAPNGTAIVGRVRTAIFGSVLVTLGLSVGILAAVIPASGLAETSIFSSTTILSRYDIFGFLALGAIGSLVVVEMCELFSTPNRLLVRGVSENCKVGAPSTILSAMAVGDLALFATCLVVVCIVYAAYRSGGLLGMAFMTIGATLPLFPISVASFFGCIATNARRVCEISNMRHEVKDVAAQVSDCSSIIRAMVHGYTTVASFFTSVATLFGFAIIMSLGATGGASSSEIIPYFGMKFFSAHVAAFAILGCAVNNLLSATLLLGMSRCSRSMFVLFEETLHNTTGQQGRDILNSSQLSQDNESLDESWMTNLSSSMFLFTLVGLGFAVLLPPLIGLIAGGEALVAFLLGTTVASYSSTFKGTSLGSTTDAVSLYVGKGGLRDTAQLTKQAAASRVSASVGLPIRAAYGPCVVGLSKLMAATCIVLAPVLSTHGSGEVQ